MKLYIEAGHRIRLLREQEGYTRERLAELAEISPKFLYEIEMGKKGFSAYTLAQLAAILRVSTDYILYGEKEIDYVSDKIERFGSVQKDNVIKLLDIIYDICT